AWPLENNHLRGRPAATRHDRTVCARRSHQRADVSRLCEAMPCADPQARRDRADGPSAGPQGRRHCGGDRSSGRDVDLSSEVFAGPQPDRAGLQQTQGASAQGGRAYNSATLASDRSRRYRFQPARMQELLSPCRLCSNMTGIRSKDVHASIPTLGFPVEILYADNSDRDIETAFANLSQKPGAAMLI